MVCHPERSEGSLQLFSLPNCGDASPAKRDQHDSVPVACFTYLRNAALAPFFIVLLEDMHFHRQIFLGALPEFREEVSQGL
jgi:hypothetical protein